MKNIIMIIAVLLNVLYCRAADFNYAFSSERLSEALTKLAEEHKELRLNFIYNELDNYRTSAKINTTDAYTALRQLVGSNPIAIVQKGSRFYLEALQRGKYRFTGRTVDPDGEPLTAVHVMLLAPKDSTVITYGMTDADGYFNIPCDRKTVLMKFSAYGFRTLYRQASDFNVGKVVLRQKPVELRNVVIEADNTVLESDKSTYIPSAQQKNASQDATDLLRRMAIPQLVINPGDKAVHDVFGSPVAVYINYHPAAEDELIGLKITDVRKVEYIEYPSDPRFGNSPKVVNLIVAEYEYGGYTKTVEEFETLNGMSNNTSVFSKFTYKKMTYDLFAGSQNKNHHHSGTELTSNYKVENDGEASIVKRDEIFDNSHFRNNKYPITVRASYYTTKFSARNSLSFSHYSAPEQSVDGGLQVSLHPENDYTYSRRSPNRNNSVSYNGNFWTAIGRGVALEIRPTFGHTHRNNVSEYESSLMSAPINNCIIENTYNWSLLMNASLAIRTKLRFNLELNGGHNLHKLEYTGSNNIRDSYSGSYGAGFLQMAYRTTKLSFQIRGGFYCDRNSINGITTTDFTPDLSANIQIMLSKKSRVTAFFYNQTTTPGIDMRAADVVQSNEFLYLTGNPCLKNWRSIITNLAYNWYMNNSFSAAVFAGYNRDNNRVSTVYEPFKDGSALLRTFVNNGSYRNMYVGAQANWRLLKNALQLYANVAENFYRTSGIYSTSLAQFRLQLQAVYYWKAFNVLASWVSPRNTLTENSNVIIRGRSNYLISVGWGNGVWNVNLGAWNIFRKSWLLEKWEQTTPLYSEVKNVYDPARHQSISLSVTYTVGYGKKIRQSDEVNAASEAPSAIIR